MAFEYSKLRGKIREIYSTQADFAKAMGLSKTSLSLRLNNQREFTQQDINRAIEILKIEETEISTFFFTQKV